MRPSRAAEHLVHRLHAQLAEDPRAVLGPIPGTRISGTTPGGVAATSFSSAAMCPLAISSPTLSAMVSPTPGSSTNRPCSESLTTDSGVSRSVFAARR